MLFEENVFHFKIKCKNLVPYYRCLVLKIAIYVRVRWTRKNPFENIFYKYMSPLDSILDLVLSPEDSYICRKL